MNSVARKITMAIKTETAATNSTSGSPLRFLLLAIQDFTPFQAILDKI